MLITRWGIFPYHGESPYPMEFKIEEPTIYRYGLIEFGPQFGTLKESEARLENIARRRAAEQGRKNTIPQDYAGLVIFKVVLNIRNPVTFPNAETWTIEAIARSLQLHPKETSLTEKQRENIINIAKNVNVSAVNRLAEIRNLLIHWGFDAIKFKTEDGDSYIPFFSYQVESPYRGPILGPIR
ncbi:MAG: hypothetical protein QXL94_01825 [Candidatus Parvarchaeum sp.]